MHKLQNFKSIAKKIVCVGRNYADHAAELGNKIPEKPMIFVKTSNSLVSEGNKIITPIGCNDLHQEVELAVIFNGTVSKVLEVDAMKYVGGYAVALDMTARDFQNDAKKAGAPWFLAKSFDTSCPISDFIPKEKIPDPHNVELFCHINGRVQQKCMTNVMIFNIPILISYISQFITLEEGDILLTGTPSGVSKVVSGDCIEFGLTDISKTKIFIS
uniref:Oxaloacetate tautomerase FAHD1, mitochondrial n=1 Tax=Strongyloides venezuelensis TaxID=75913 RepID=A0A0K0FBG6_STRVS